MSDNKSTTDKDLEDLLDNKKNNNSEEEAMAEDDFDIDDLFDDEDEEDTGQNDIDSDGADDDIDIDDLFEDDDEDELDKNNSTNDNSDNESEKESLVDDDDEDDFGDLFDDEDEEDEDESNEDGEKDNNEKNEEEESNDEIDSIFDDADEESDSKGENSDLSSTNKEDREDFDDSQDADSDNLDDFFEEEDEDDTPTLPKEEYDAEEAERLKRQYEEINQEEEIEEEDDFEDFDESNFKTESKKKKKSLFGKFGKNKKEMKKEELEDNQDPVEESNNVNEEEDITSIIKGKTKEHKAKKHKSDKKRKTGNRDSNWVPIVVSVGLTLAFVVGGGVVFKDQIADFMFMEQEIKITNLERSVESRLSKTAENVEEIKESSSRVYLEKESFEDYFDRFYYEDALTVKELEESLLSFTDEFENIENNIGEISSRLGSQDEVNSEIEGAINEIVDDLENQKQLIGRTAQISLDVIQQSREMESRLSDSIYEKISTQVREDMRKQRQELYDFSVIEDRLTNALNRISELTREVSMQREERQKLMSELNSLRNQVNDLSENENEAAQEDVVEPTEDGNKVIEELTRNSDNTISIQRSRGETDSNLGVEGKSNLPKYNIVAVLEDKFYVRDEIDGKIKRYFVGDNLDHYGKVIRIENNNIVAEKGIVRKL